MTFQEFRITLILALFSVSLVHAKDEGSRTFISVEEAGQDYLLQGEYDGVLGRENKKWGAHVIATGNGSFEAVGYVGGLPGDGWTGEPGQRLSGKAVDGSVTMKAENFAIEVNGQTLQVMGTRGNVVGMLTKRHRQSETLGMKSPAEAVVLFDGSSVDEWHDAKLVQDHLLGATNCYSKKKFGDHRLHLEFRTPFMPESSGQARGNSGVYIQGRYELQVLDSFGLDGKDNECGGIYKIASPRLNMCYPPLVWQTYDIDFTAAKYDATGSKVANARVTIRHNGVLIHEDLELPHHTPGRHEEGPDPEALFLQNHGNPVAYRNIWALEK